MSGTQDISITLTLEQWNVLRTALATAPLALTASFPVMTKLEQQLRPYLEPRPNGQDRLPSDEARE